MSTIPNPDQIKEKWLSRLDSLLEQVQGWANELDWTNRRIEIGLSDSQFGKYKAPALLLQEGVIRILFEPIASSAPGTEGVVDIYLMPAYDDIASLYFYEDAWHVHYMFPGAPEVGDIRDANGKLLSKETLREVLEAMKHNAV